MNKVVSFHYTLKDASGEVLEDSRSDEPMSYLEGVGQIIPGLEKELNGLKKGDKKAVHVKAKDAYGEYDDSLVAEVPRGALPKKDVEIGDQFHAQGEDGHPRIVTVTEVTDQTVTVEGVRGLGGQLLNFDLDITQFTVETNE
jgi:FKBP-type peptidyl-prolyl cis-trans isomerase SlyD